MKYQRVIDKVKELPYHCILVGTTGLAIGVLIVQAVTEGIENKLSNRRRK